MNESEHPEKNHGLMERDKLQGYQNSTFGPPGIWSCFPPKMRSCGPTDRIGPTVRGVRDRRILDVRPEEDFLRGHLRGAYNVPWADMASRGFELLGLVQSLVALKLETIKQAQASNPSCLMS